MSVFSSSAWNNWDLVIIHDGFHRLSLYGGSNVALSWRSFTLLTTKEKSLLYQEDSFLSRKDSNRREEKEKKRKILISVPVCTVNSPQPPTKCDLRGAARAVCLHAEEEVEVEVRTRTRGKRSDGRIGAALNLSGHSWLQRDNRGVESAGRRRAELLFMPLIRDTPRHDTPTTCGTALRHKRALKHPTRYYSIFFFFLDHSNSAFMTV